MLPGQSENEYKATANSSFSSASEELIKKQTIQAFKLQRKQRLQALLVKRTKNFAYLKVSK